MTSDLSVSVRTGARPRPTVEREPVDDPFDDRDATSAIVARSEMAVGHVDLATHRIVSVSDAAVAILKGSRREIVGRLVTDFVADEPTGALPLLATGKLDGFEAGRRLLRCDGEVIEAFVWAHVLGSRRPARFGAVFVSLDPEPMSLHLAAGAADRRVVGTVDDEWRIDRISLEVEAILGYRARHLAGAPLLSAVHPNDLSELLAGLAHIQATRRDAVVRLRVCKADRTWLWCRCRVSALDESPRFAFTLRPLADSPRSSVDRTRELEQRLARIAHEVRASGVAVPTPRSPVLSEVPELADLTSREWQVLGRLADGTRVPTIAGELGLSASTVRNHLSGIFQKLGVRSQAELLDRLRAQT